MWQFQIVWNFQVLSSFICLLVLKSFYRSMKFLPLSILSCCLKGKHLSLGHSRGQSNGLETGDLLLACISDRAEKVKGDVFPHLWHVVTGELPTLQPLSLLRRAPLLSVLGIQEKWLLAPSTWSRGACPGYGWGMFVLKKWIGINIFMWTPMKEELRVTPRGKRRGKYLGIKWLKR